MFDTGSAVAQLLPQLKLKIPFTKIHSWTYQRVVEAELLADRLDLFGGGEQPTEDFRRVAAEELEEEENEQDDPGKRGDHLPEPA